MRTLPKMYIDLQSGFTRVNEFNRKLQDEWGEKMALWRDNAASEFAEKQAEYQSARAAWDDLHHRIAGPNMLAYVLFALAAFLAIPGLGCYGLFYAETQPLAAFFVALAVQVIGVLALCYWGAKSRIKAEKTHADFLQTNPGAKLLQPARNGKMSYLKPRQPTRKLPIPLDILSAWWLAIQSEESYDNERDTVGLVGEIRLWNALKSALPDTFLAVHGIIPGGPPDIDVLVMAPSGVWVLDSKYWNGYISYENGRWSHKKIYHIAGGIEQVEEKNEGDLAREWKQEVYSVVSKIKEMYPNWYVPVHGGIVFTHDNGEISNDSQFPVKVGTIPQWVEEIQNSKPNAWMTEEKMLTMLDILLINSNTNAGSKCLSSMMLAEDLYNAKQKALQKFFDAS